MQVKSRRVKALRACTVCSSVWTSRRGRPARSGGPEGGLSLFQVVRSVTRTSPTERLKLRAGAQASAALLTAGDLGPSPRLALVSSSAEIPLALKLHGCLSSQAPQEVPGCPGWSPQQPSRAEGPRCRGRRGDGEFQSWDTLLFATRRSKAA